MLLFRSEEELERWLAARGLPRGGSMSVPQAWHLAQLWDPDRLEPGWRPRTPAEAEAIFREVGLSGEFWQLR